MSGFLGRLFGTEKALEATISGVTKGLDALVYTDEEKAGDAAKDRSEARSMVVGWMEATSGQNLSRRIISLAITFTWLSQYLLGQFCTLVAVWAVDKEPWRTSAKVLVDGAATMDSAVMLILAFYFAAPHMSGIVEVVLGKFKEKVK